MDLLDCVQAEQQGQHSSEELIVYFKPYTPAELLAISHTAAQTEDGIIVTTTPTVSCIVPLLSVGDVTVESLMKCTQLLEGWAEGASNQIKQLQGEAVLNPMN